MTQNISYVFGIHSVEETLKSGGRRLIRLYISGAKKDPAIEEITALARRRSIPISIIDEQKLDKLSNGGNHQGALLEAEPVSPLNLNQVLSSGGINKDTVWIGVDEITDPHNLGAIIRSAACLGASAVVFPERRSAGITPIVEKTASGAVEKVKLISVVNLNQAILKLKEHSFWIYGASLEGKPLHEASFYGPIFLLIGSEGRGLREKTAGHCDELVRIPMKGGVQSLNASCACSVILYHIAQKRERSSG